MHDTALQALAMLCSLCGMGWLALAMDVHHAQVLGTAGPSPRAARWRRTLAMAAIAASLAACLAANHASIAVLVWVMSLVASSLLVAFVLASRPRWLAWLARPACLRR